MSTEAAVDAFAQVREARRAAALVTYRRACAAMAAGDALPPKQSADLDAVMVRLAVGDDELAGDVAALKKRREHEAAAAAIQSRLAEIDADLQGAQERLSQAQSDYEEGPRRIAEAESAVQAAGAPLSRMRGHEQAITRIVEANPRLFSPLADGDG